MRLTPEQQALVTDNARVATQAAWFVIRTHGITVDLQDWGMEDVVSAANEALCRAAISWDPKQGEFGAYATHIVRHRVLDWLRLAGSRTRTGVLRRPDTVSLDTVLADGRPLSELVEDPNASADADVTSRDNIIWLLGKLQPREQKVAWMLHVEHLTQDQVGERMGITGSRVSQINARAMSRLRRDFDVWKAA